MMIRIKPGSRSKLWHLMGDPREDTELGRMRLVEFTGDEVRRLRNRASVFEQMTGDILVADEARLVEEVTVPQIRLPQLSAPFHVWIRAAPLCSLQRNPAESSADFCERTTVMPVLLKKGSARL